MPRKDDIYDLHVEIPIGLGRGLDKFSTFKGAKRQIVMAALIKEIRYLEKMNKKKK